MTMDEEEKIRLTARRVGFDLPELHVPEASRKTNFLLLIHGHTGIIALKELTVDTLSAGILTTSSLQPENSNALPFSIPRTDEGRTLRIQEADQFVAVKMLMVLSGKLRVVVGAVGRDLKGGGVGVRGRAIFRSTPSTSSLQPENSNALPFSIPRTDEGRTLGRDLKGGGVGVRGGGRDRLCALGLLWTF
jgi:hypothetical protein